jgi:hypothetical protein
MKNTQYIEYMTNLRAATRLISGLVPEILEVMQMKAQLERHEEIEILLMPDKAFHILVDKYEEIEPKLYRFNPDEEYGIVRTMNAEEMRGEA